jgi:hypothetical protein
MVQANCPICLIWQGSLLLHAAAGPLQVSPQSWGALLNGDGMF